MSKELKPLRALKEIGKLKESGCYINTTVEYKMVEQELKRLEELEIMYSNCVIEGAKQKKALEIIKEKKVCVAWLKNGLSAYNSTAALYNLPRLNEEEYNLLKETLL